MVNFVAVSDEAVYRDIRKLVENIFLGKASSFPIRCPNCFKRHLHVLWIKYSESRAGFWLWCSSCGISEHSSTRPPIWWKNIDDPSVLSELIISNFDIYKSEIDRYVNRLLRDYASHIIE